jgi:ketosteroid isomerase-like protein
MFRIAAFLLLAMRGFVAFAAEPSDVDRFTQLEKAWATAIKAQDRAALERTLAPEYTLTVAMTDGLQRVDRDRWLDNAVGPYVLHDYTFDEVVVRRYGDTAVVSSRYSQKATVNGRDRSGSFFLTDIWVHAGGQWRVSARYSSRLEARPPKPPG